MAEIIINETELKNLQQNWEQKIKAHEKYWLENDAKLRAITSAKSYEEFSDIVKAAHLKPLTKKELAELQHKVGRTNFRAEVASSISNFDEESEVKINKVSTAAEFSTYWIKLDDEKKYDLIRKLSLEDLDYFMQREVPVGMLGDLTRILRYDPKEEEWLLSLLKILTKSNRFQLNLMFMSTKEIDFFKTLLDSITLDKEDVRRVKYSFGVLK
ncbi:coiled-coil domain-containing protein 103 isoform X2 [Neocloeon triangulifer]|uniref:coiled-coil domain-containing protein 103 isoform X2 n=1 Tax=Neocloeon triangulifer TaxID=2078957 RepID=UPI00286F0C17|nr:coiled-coil domain-containing protein 103 isoform X2 [Neocloeon triangulifer]